MIDFKVSTFRRRAEVRLLEILRLALFRSVVQKSARWISLDQRMHPSSESNGLANQPKSAETFWAHTYQDSTGNLSLTSAPGNDHAISKSKTTTCMHARHICWQSEDEKFDSSGRYNLIRKESNEEAATPNLRYTGKATHVTVTPPWFDISRDRLHVTTQQPPTHLSVAAVKEVILGMQPSLGLKEAMIIISI